MNDVIACPSCDRKLRLVPELMGQAVKCPACGTNFMPAEELPRLEPEERPPPRESARRDDRDDRDRPARSRRYEEEEDDDRPRRRRRGLDDHRGGMILALGICSLVICLSSFVTGPMAWAMGAGDLREMREGRMDPEGESMTRVGMILGIIATVGFGLMMAGYCLIVAVIAAAAA